jgi:ABC-type sugar transport system ATPase subunit
LTVTGVAKSFGATVAVADASVEFREGEIHAIVGENGSGKSTLVKILSGVYRPDRGAIRVAGRSGEPFLSPAQALAAGVATVYQEVLTVGARSVLENVWYGADGLWRRRVPAAAKRAQAAEMLYAILGAEIDLGVPTEQLSLSERQACGIARALVRRPRLLILDEATSALDVASRERLFALLNSSSRGGMAVVFISHRMDEIEQLGDRVTVMRSGRIVATLDRARAASQALVRLMTGEAHLVGETVRTAAPRSHRSTLTTVLSATGLRIREGGPTINFDLRAGELVGLSGLEGHGQDAFLRRLWGLSGAGGDVRVITSSGAVPIGTTSEATDAGIAYVPRERRNEALFESMTIRENFGLPTLRRDGRLGFFSPGATGRRLAAYVPRLRLKLGDDTNPVTTLSGGNQQKLILARWLATEPRILLLNDPTRGVDLNAKRDIYGVLRGLSAAGVAVVMLSTELDELVELMDRVLVFRDHRLAAELSRDALSQASLLAAFFGTDSRGQR